MVNKSYKSHPAPRTPQTVENLGPANIASSPEALLLAGVIRQAVEDYATTETAVEHIASRKYARRLIRNQARAEKFLFEELEAFLAHFDVSHIFHRETIVRQVKKTAGIEPLPAPAPETIPATQLGYHFTDSANSIGGGESSMRRFDRIMPRNQMGLYS